MSASVGWGILGTGGIAALFASDLGRVEGARALAVGSRSASAAESFGDRFDIPRRHGSYGDLVADPAVDVVYVATPPPHHPAAARLAISAGKAVLCEKPFTLSAAEARSLVAATRAAGTFLMEAMWTRFLPHMTRVRNLVFEGALGEVRLVHAEVGQLIPPDPAHRLRAPELGGGALLDLGIYPLSLCSMVLGRPVSIAAVSAPSPTGVDAQTAALLDHGQGRHGVIAATLEANTPTVASITGPDGCIEIESPWYKPSAFTLTDRHGHRERFASPGQGRGMQHQAAEVVRCLRAGLPESPVMPLAETVSIMESVDEIRRQIGLTYPGEKAPPAADLSS